MKRSERPRSLRTFVFTAIGIATVCCIAVIVFVFLGNMMRMLKQAEHNHLSELGDTIHGAIATELYNLRFSTRAWSSWDETYLYTLGKNDGFIRENLEDGTHLATYQVDFVVIKDTAGRNVYVGSRATKSGSLLDVPGGLSDRFTTIGEDILKKHRPTSGEFLEDGPNFDTGFIAMGEESYMFCTMPILKTDDSGKAVGTLSFAKIFGDEQMRTLTRLDTTRFSIREADPSNPLSEDRYELKGKDTVVMETPLDGLGDARNSILEIDHPRVLYTNGRALIMTTTLVLFLALLAIMAALLITTERHLLRPLGRLIAEVDKVDRNESIDERRYEQYEELNTLAHAIKDMLERLNESHQAAEQSKISITVLENILNGLDAYLYVSDPTTDEILFINDKMKNHFAIEGEPVGKTCWKLLQSGFSERCDFCPCYSLEKNPSEPVVWEEHNTVTGHYYRNTDSMIGWTDGRKMHLQHSVDITDIKTAEFALQKRLDQQALMTSITRNFLSDEDLDTLIAEALKMTGEFMGIARILLIRHDEKVGRIECRGEWRNVAEDFPRQLGRVIELKASDRSAVIENLARETIEYVDSGDIEIGAQATRYFPEVARFLLIPVFADGALWGVLDFGKSERSKWTQSDVDLAKLVASVLAGVLSRQRMENQLRSLSAIVESSPQYISYLTNDGRIDYVNPAATAITGYTKEELVAGGLDLLYSEDDVRRIREEFVPQILRQGQLDFELELVRKDGEKRVMAFSAFITGMEDNKLGGIASDITEMRKLEKELIAAKELAEEGSRAKSEFLSRMSHEIRTPMNAIIGMTSIAQGTDDPKKKDYSLEKIAGASRHLLGVINDILDMSKIEAGRFELSASEFSFDRMLMNVINVVNFRMQEKAQRLEQNVDSTMPRTLIGDEQRLSQVITNLLTNAAKFTPERGRINLDVRVLQNEEAGVTLQIEVEDNGIGITREQQAKLFRSFEQADGSIARKFGGTGLGLAISKRIVELMGGQIWVESEPDVGSKFIFTVNLQRGSRQALDNGKRKPGVGKLNILVVDDSQETLDYILHIMAALGIPCVAAPGAREALQIVDESDKPFDLILVDWKMPDVDGIELTRELKKRKGSRSVIVMISASEWTEIEKEATDAGVDGFLAKPLFPSLIMDCINRYMSSSVLNEMTGAPPSGRRRFPGKSLLLVEDIDINREIVTTILEDTDLLIDCATNGREAVEMFAADPSRYDIIFMDVHMPEMDGLEATRRIRAMEIPQALRVPIVAMTANVFREDIEKCLQAGMNDHIGKPVDFDELFGKLEKYLG